MSPRDLCPSCRTTFSEPTAAKVQNHGGQSFDQPSVSLKCGKCYKVFSSTTQTRSESLNNKRVDSKVRRNSHISTSLTNKTDHLDPLAIQRHSTGDDNYNTVEPMMSSAVNYSTGLNINGDECVSASMTIAATQESNEKMDLELNEESKSCGATFHSEDEMKELNSESATMISGNCAGQNPNLKVFLESFCSNLSSEFTIDLGTNGSKFIKQSEVSQLSQTKPTTYNIKTLLSHQPQEEETGSDLAIASADLKGCSISLTCTEKIPLSNEENSREIPSSTEGKKLNKSRISRYRRSAGTIFSIMTEQKVTCDEINSKIDSNFTIVHNDVRKYICKMDHDCRKKYKCLNGIVEHLFSHLFFFCCSNCKLRYYFRGSFKKHLKTCKESIATNFGPKDIKLKSETERNSSESFYDWTEPIYCSYTRRKVSMDEMRINIAENYAIARSRRPPYICLIDHDCQRSFKKLGMMKEHLFENLYWFNCSFCGAKFNRTSLYKHHLMVCDGKAKSNQSSSVHSVSKELAISKPFPNSSFSGSVNRQSIASVGFMIENLLKDTKKKSSTVTKK